MRRWQRQCIDQYNYRKYNPHIKPRIKMFQFLPHCDIVCNSEVLCPFTLFLQIHAELCISAISF